MERPGGRWLSARDSSSRPWQDCPAPRGTVGLLTAARVLGLEPAHARDLAACGVFPCAVITTAGGYRVSFEALVRLLRDRGPSSADGDM